MQISVYRFATGALLALLLAGCGDAGEQSASQAPEPELDNTREVADYYAANPDFFSFKTLDDVPGDLAWENGDHLPEIGSPQATKGGTLYGRLQDFPRTLRTIGPDSNGSFRALLLDDVGMTLAKVHPENLELYPGLAEAWAVDWEHRTVYIKLDPRATYSDGVPITADDYLFMFWFYRSPYVNAPWYNNFYGSQYTNITRYDDHLISISMPEAKPDMPNRALQIQPIPRHFYREVGDDFTERYQWRFAPTPGAYVVREEDIRKGRSIALTRLGQLVGKGQEILSLPF